MKRLITLLSAAFLLALPLHATDLGGKVIQIGTDPTYPPHESIDENTKQVVGYDVDVVVEICKLVNCVPVWNPTSWEGIFPALAQGSWDMVVSGVTITDERDKIVDFSDPYIIVQQGVERTAGGLAPRQVLEDRRRLLLQLALFSLLLDGLLDSRPS